MEARSVIARVGASTSRRVGSGGTPMWKKVVDALAKGLVAMDGATYAYFVAMTAEAAGAYRADAA
jgi:hypothetical protein